jgi:hypothetical protein
MDEAAGLDRQILPRDIEFSVAWLKSFPWHLAKLGRQS